MKEIPIDVMQIAVVALNTATDIGDDGGNPFEPIARAIMAERERCAKIVEEHSVINPHNGRWGLKKRTSPSMRANCLAMAIRGHS